MYDVTREGTAGWVDGGCLSTKLVRGSSQEVTSLGACLCTPRSVAACFWADECAVLKQSAQDVAVDTA